MTLGNSLCANHYNIYAYGFIKNQRFAPNFFGIIEK